MGLTGLHYCDTCRFKNPPRGAAACRYRRVLGGQHGFVEILNGHGVEANSVAEPYEEITDSLKKLTALKVSGMWTPPARPGLKRVPDRRVALRPVS